MRRENSYTPEEALTPLPSLILLAYALSTAGHIAKAEQRLHEVLGSVDVVVEVRDARIPASTTHPMVDDWLRNRNAKRVVVMTKIDLVPK